MAEEKVRVTLKSTYGYFNARKGVKENWGPGENIEVPKGLAYSLGLLAKSQPVEKSPVPETSQDPAVDDLTLLGLSATVLAALQEAGFTTFASIAAATDDALIAIKGVGAQTAERIKAITQEQMAQERES